MGVDILFICGTLEMGKDGVGDYTRKVVACLRKTGITSKIAAIYDYYLNDIEEYKGEDEYRISAKLNTTVISKKVIAFLLEQQPKRVCIQYVPFAYDKRGIAPWINSIVKEIGNKRIPVAIMFHELWAGMAKQDSLKIKLLGTLQQIFIIKLLKCKQVDHIATQTALYQSYIRKYAGRKAELLPLISNIAISETPNIAPISSHDVVQMVVFGTIHQSIEVASFLGECKTVLPIPLEILFIGRNGPYLADWILACEKLGLKYKVIGECSEHRVASVLRMADVGIVTTPYMLVGKSGSAMAMLAAGLKVICVASPWTPRGMDDFMYEDISVFEYKKGTLPQFWELKIGTNRFVHAIPKIQHYFARLL